MNESVFRSSSETAPVSRLSREDAEDIRTAARLAQDAVATAIARCDEMDAAIAAAGAGGYTGEAIGLNAGIDMRLAGRVLLGERSWDVLRFENV